MTSVSDMRKELVVKSYDFSQWYAEGRWFSPGTPISFTNKTGSHDIIDRNTINHHQQYDLTMCKNLCW
jgi:hypothetical protein